MLAEIAPELGGLGDQRVHDHQPFQLGEAFDQLALVGRGGQRIEPLGDIAVHPALVHQLEHLQHVVEPVQLGQVVVAPVVLRPWRRLPHQAFMQADVEFAGSSASS